MLPVIKETKEQPVINSVFVQNKDWGEPRSMDLNALIYWVKRTPECIGIVKRIATDIVTEIRFYSIASQLTGRPSPNFHKKAEDRAMSFWRKNLGKQKLISAVLDWLITGDAYIWKGRITDKDFKEVGINCYKNLGIEIKESEIDVSKLKNEMKQFLDEDPNLVNAIKIVPSSMVRINHDDRRIINYIQRSKVNPSETLEFSPEEIIHAKFLDIDGKVYGFSPMESSWMAIKTINAIQDYNYNYFANGVKPDRAWLFEGNPSKEMIDKHEEQLKKYKSVTSAHGDLIVAGADKIKIETLNEPSESMQHRQLAINSVGRLAFAFNMPADTLSSILGVDVKGTAMGSDIEDAGYNRNIIEAQKYWEMLLNTQLFNEFDVELMFEVTFRQDLIRQIQYKVQATPFVEFLFKHDYPVTDEYIHHLLQIDRKYLRSGKIDRESQEAKPFQFPVQKGANQEKLSAAKKIQQKPQQDNQPQVGS